MDYRFAIRCWQDQAGDENAKANVFVNGTQVVTEAEITATGYDTAQVITWESAGLTGDTAEIKVVLTNEYYVDAETDRNIRINGIGYLNKSGDDYVDGTKLDTSAEEPYPNLGVNTVVTDFSDFNNYFYVTPTAVSGDGMADDYWTSRESENAFYTVLVSGGDAVGSTMTVPISTTTIFTP